MDGAVFQGATSGRWFGVGMLLLGAGLAANAVFGPPMVDPIDYPFTETVRNETYGLEAISEGGDATIAAWGPAMPDALKAADDYSP